MDIFKELLRDFDDNFSFRETLSIGGMKSLALSFPFLDQHNDCICIYVTKNKDSYLVTEDGFIGADWHSSDDREVHVRPFLDAFNLSRCSSNRQIQHTPEDGFFVRTDEKHLASTIWMLLAFLVKYIGVIEYETTKVDKQ